MPSLRVVILPRIILLIILIFHNSSWLHSEWKRKLTWKRKLLYFLGRRLCNLIWWLSYVNGWQISLNLYSQTNNWRTNSADIFLPTPRFSFFANPARIGLHKPWIYLKRRLSLHPWRLNGKALFPLSLYRPTPREVGIDAVASRLAEFKISGLLVIGGFEAFECMVDLVEGRSEHKELCIPMIMIPATISNNVPGTDFSLGADTALNEITLVRLSSFSPFGQRFVSNREAFRN